MLLLHTDSSIELCETGQHDALPVTDRPVRDVSKIYIHNRGCPRAYTKSMAAHVQCLRLSDVNRLTKSMAAHVQCLRLSVVNRLTPFPPLKR